MGLYKQSNTYKNVTPQYTRNLWGAEAIPLRSRKTNPEKRDSSVLDAIGIGGVFE